METFNDYLWIINIIGFIIYIINMLLYRYTIDKEVDGLLNIISLLGGSLGIIIAILLFDRKSEKENMMSRVYVTCIFIIELIIFIMFKFNIIDGFTLNIVNFFHKYKFLLTYLGIINFITFVVFALDKFNALTHKHRYRIVTLLGLSFIGGSIGGLLAMYIFRHKTQKDYFTVGIPLIMLMQLVVIIFLTNVFN